MVSINVLGGYMPGPGPSPNRVAEAVEVNASDIEVLMAEDFANPPILSLFAGAGAAPLEGKPQRHYDVANETGAALAARIGGLEKVNVVNTDSSFTQDPSDRVVKVGWINLSRVRSVKVHDRGGDPPDASLTFHSWRSLYVSEPPAELLALA